MFCLLRGANVNIKTIHLKLFKSPLHNSTYNTNVTNLFRPNQTRGNLLFKGNRTSQSSNKDSFLTTTLSLFVRRQRTNVAQSGKKAAETVKAQKLDKNGLMRLIKLAKPEKYKLAGNNSLYLFQIIVEKRYLLVSFERWFSLVKIIVFS